MSKYHGPVIPSILPKGQPARRASQALRLTVGGILETNPKYVKAAAGKKNTLTYKHDKKLDKSVLDACRAFLSR